MKLSKTIRREGWGHSTSQKMGESRKSKLFSATVLEGKDDFEEKFEKGFEAYKKVVTGLSDREAHDALVIAVSRSMHEYEDISMGLMYLILTDVNLAQNAYRDLTFIARDGMHLVWNKLTMLISERFAKMTDTTRKQILWLTREMVQNEVSGVDNVVSALVKQIAGGDISQRNIWLTENLLDLLSENKEWLEKFPVLMAMVVYTYLRVIEDHWSPTFTHLRQREVDFCVHLLRTKFVECCRIGRDLIRLLQGVARIPEFEKIWKDILNQPQTLSPHFSGIMQLLQQRTPSKYLACRLTPDIEKKIHFFTSKVRFGQQKRYQDWFQKQFLNSPESQSLRCDLIRYICCNIHPSNEILSSDIIQRWAVIGWLLTTCTSNVAASNAKLALFYDWLVFSPTRGNIMDIEPGILVMHHSMRSHPAITATLLDFLCRIIPNFYPPLTSQIRQGVTGALRFIMEKRVLPTLSPLFDNPRLDKELRSMIKENFSEFCTQEVKTPTKEEPLAIEIPNNLDSPTEKLLSPDDAAFSDDEEESSKSPVQKPKDIFFKPIKQEEEIDLEPFLEQLEGSIKQICGLLQSQREADMEDQCGLMDELCAIILESRDFDSDVALPLAQFLCGLYNQHLTGSILPEEINDESMEDSLGKPIYVIFRNLSAVSDEGTCPIQLLTLVCVMYEKQPNIGYNLLYFLHASGLRQENSKLHVYEEVINNTDTGNLSRCLVKDFMACQEEDVSLLCYLIPSVYTQFEAATVPNTALLNSIVSCIDSTQLQSLICKIMQGDLVMFKKESLAHVIETTLTWETFEQYCVWQLLSAHDIEVEHLIPIVPKLSYKDHPEAIASLLLMFKMETASVELLKPILLRSFENGDQLTTSLLSHWVVQDEQLLADLFKNMLQKSTTAAKRARISKPSKQQHPTPDQLLGHLNSLRLTEACRKSMFFSQEALLQGLQHVQHVCSDNQKTQFSDLFALLEVIEDLSRSTRSRVAKRSPSYSTSPKSKRPPLQEESSDSEQDDDIKPKATKKRKKNATIGSDSD